jgi:uncharacterized protein YjdB
MVLALVPTSVSCGSNSDTGTVTGVVVVPKDISVAVGETRVLTATVTPFDATDKTIAWTSSRPDVVTVVGTDHEATVTAVAPGETAITVKTNDGGKTDTCDVKVMPRVTVTGVNLDKSMMSLFLIPGYPAWESDSLAATVEPPNATDKTVTWESSALGVATVVGAGLDATVTAVAPGATVITVMTNNGGKTATCTVRVAGPIPVTPDRAAQN